jgi:hypothetical protein
MAREEYDGTRSYPYKTMGYYLWIYNEVEKNRDKNMFIYNFMREQYNCGVGSMEMMTKADEPTINMDEVKKEVGKSKMEEIESIANAEPITDEQRDIIKAKIEREEDVDNAEIYSFKRKNLLDCYDLSERNVHAVFVENFDKSNMKRAYHNRKELREKGLENIVKEESDNFNAIFLDEVSVQDDLKKKYKSMKLVIAKELIEIAGFDGFYDTETVSKEDIMSNFKEKEDLLDSRMDGICNVLGRDKRRRPYIKNWEDKYYLRGMLDFINSILVEQLQLKIKQTGHRSGIYYIDGINTFDLPLDSIYFRKKIEKVI